MNASKPLITIHSDVLDSDFIEYLSHRYTPIISVSIAGVTIELFAKTA